MHVYKFISSILKQGPSYRGTGSTCPSPHIPGAPRCPTKNMFNVKCKANGQGKIVHHPPPPHWKILATPILYMYLCNDTLSFYFFNTLLWKIMETEKENHNLFSPCEREYKKLREFSFNYRCVFRWLCLCVCVCFFGLSQHFINPFNETCGLFVLSLTDRYLISFGSCIHSSRIQVSDLKAWVISSGAFKFS